MNRPAVAAFVALLLAGCGEEERAAPPAAPAGDTRLEVEVRPEGPGGPVERRVVDKAPPGVTPRALAPVPADAACTQIYGGPAVARVTGRLDGRPVDATFNRANGCEIARWDRLESLLGRPPGPGRP